jgi:hypothetical protein
MIRLLVRLIFLAFGIFLKRSLKTKYQAGANNGFQGRKTQNGEDIIDADFKEIK